MHQAWKFPKFPPPIRALWLVGTGQNTPSDRLERADWSSQSPDKTRLWVLWHSIHLNSILCNMEKPCIIPFRTITPCAVSINDSNGNSKCIAFLHSSTNSWQLASSSIMAYTCGYNSFILSYLLHSQHLALVSPDLTVAFTIIALTSSITGRGVGSGGDMRIPSSGCEHQHPLTRTRICTNY